MQPLKIVNSTNIVNRITFKLKNNLIHDTLCYKTNGNTKLHIQAQVNSAKKPRESIVNVSNDDVSLTYESWHPVYVIKYVQTRKSTVLHK